MPIGKGLKRMCVADKKVLFVKFSTGNLVELQKKNYAQNLGKAYLTDRKFAKFTEYINKSIKSKQADDLTSCNCYSCLNM